MVEITLPIVLQILQTAGILVGIIYYITIMRNSQRNQQVQLETRQAQLFMPIYNRMTYTDFTEKWNELMIREWTDYDDYYEKYGQKTNPKAFSTFQSIEFYFEGIGVLVARKLIDVSMVDDMMSSVLLLFWEKYSPIILETRQRVNLPQIDEWTEYLYNEVRRVTDKQHPELAT
jgi:hypothetical protein